MLEHASARFGPDVRAEIEAYVAEYERPVVFLSQQWRSWLDQNCVCWDTGRVNIGRVTENWLFPELLRVDVEHFFGRPGKTAKGNAGAPPAADWVELEVALEREIEKVGPPHKGAEKDWRTKADVGRWIGLRTGDAEPGPSALKDNVSKMLSRIRAKRKAAGKSETWF